MFTYGGLMVNAHSTKCLNSVLNLKLLVGTFYIILLVGGSPICWPIREPHCEAGMMRRRVMGGLGMPGLVTRLSRSSSNLAQIKVNACSTVPQFWYWCFRKAIAKYRLSAKFKSKLKDSMPWGCWSGSPSPWRSSRDRRRLWCWSWLRSEIF